MKWFYSTLFIFSCIIFSGFAEGKIPTAQENRERAEELLCQLDVDLSRLLAREQKYIKEHEKFLKEEGVWKQMVRCQKELKRRVIKQREKLVTFRGNIGEMVSLNYGKTSLGEYEVSLAELEVTEWYVNYIRKVLCSSSLLSSNP